MRAEVGAAMASVNSRLPVGIGFVHFAMASARKPEPRPKIGKPGPNNRDTNRLIAAESS